MQHLSDNVPFRHTDKRRSFRLIRDVVNGFFRKRDGRLSVHALHRFFNDFSRRANKLAVGAVSRDNVKIRFIVRRRRRDLRKLG